MFSLVNVACLVLRRDPTPADGLRAPTWVPVLGGLACLFLVGPRARDSEDYVQCRSALGLLAVGIVLWVATWLTTAGSARRRPASVTWTISGSEAVGPDSGPEAPPAYP